MSAWEDILAAANAAGAIAVYDPDNPDTWTLREDNGEFYYTEIRDGLDNLPPLVQDQDAEQFEQVTQDGRRFASADGSGQTLFIEAEDWDTLTQPNTILAVGQHTGAGRAFIFDAISTGSGRHVIAANEGGDYAMWASSWLRSVDTTDDLRLLHAVFDGGDSRFYVDGSTAVVGAAGTHNLQSVLIGGRQKNSTADAWVGPIGPVIIFDSRKTAADLEDLRAKILQHYPIPGVIFQELDTTPAPDQEWPAQGVAYDGTHYYTISSDQLHKYTRDAETGAYTRVLTSDKGNTPAGLSQINSCAYHDGYLWIGGNNFSATPAKGWLLQYDPDDLSLVDTWELPDEAYSEGGAWRDGEWWNCYHDWDRVSRHTLQDGVLAKVDDYLLSMVEGQTTSLYQGAAWLADRLFVQRHNEHSDTTTDVYDWNGSGFDAIAAVPALRGGAGQGLHWETPGSVMLFSVRAGSDADQEILRASFSQNETDDGEDGEATLNLRRYDQNGFMPVTFVTPGAPLREWVDYIPVVLVDSPDSKVWRTDSDGFIPIKEE